ncbi:MAG: hypothetical protein ACLR1T_10485 [Evtepia gabavorous]
MGLWHGAGWNFLLWGLLFGLLLAAERLGLGGWLNRVPPLGHLFVLAVLGFGAVLLTGENLGQKAWRCGAACWARGNRGNGDRGMVCPEKLWPHPAAGRPGGHPWPSRWMARLRRGTWTGKVVAVAEPLVLAALLVISTGYLVDGGVQPFWY